MTEQQLLNKIREFFSFDKEGEMDFQELMDEREHAREILGEVQKFLEENN